jgi:hypothetical protein
MDGRHADRAVIAHLLDKHGMDKLINMIQSVSSSSKSTTSHVIGRRYASCLG